MIIKLTIGSWRFTWSMAQITTVVGVDSNLPDGNHILMWDYDMVTKDKVIAELQYTQWKYKLPNIYILKTSKLQGFHAYCFKKVDWRTCVEILASSPSLDWNYFKYGIFRGHFTLRVGSKCGRTITPLLTLESKVAEDATVKDLKSWVQYETLSDHKDSRKLEVKIYAKG